MKYIIEVYDQLHVKYAKNVQESKKYIEMSKSSWIKTV